MAKIIFGNHAAVRVDRKQREDIRKFYIDVLDSKLMRSFDGKDDFCIGDNFYISFLYGSGDSTEVDKGITYAAEDALSEADFLKAIFLELKTDDVEKTMEKIVAFGVRILNVPDPHLYFQAPGGQVFRLVGIEEDLSKYEGNN